MKIDHLNYWECRGLEQILMGSVATSVFDIKTNPNGNKINGISLRNPFKDYYLEAGYRYITNNIENEIWNLINP